MSFDFTPSVTETDVFTAFVGFLRAIRGAALGDDHIIQGQGNRTPPPPEPEFIVVTPTRRAALAQQVETNADTPDDPTTAAINVSQAMQFAVQIDVHGDSSGDTAQAIVTLFRSSFAAAQFPNNVTPLYCDDPQQMPFETSENQTENRWTFAAYVQITPQISTPAQFAGSLRASIAAPADSGA